MTGRSSAIALGLLVVGGLAVVSLGPFPQPDLPGRFESLPHVVAYAVGMLTALAATYRDPRQPVRRRDVVILAASLIAVGAILELAQRLVGRDVESTDVLANALGVVIGVAVWSALRRFVGSAAGRDR